MIRSVVSSVDEYRVADGAIHLECATAADRPRTVSGARTVPVTLDFLAPASFRFRLDANPEAGAGPDPVPFEYERVTEPVDLSAQESEGRLRIETGALVVEVGLDEWEFRVANATGETLFEEHREPLGFAGIDELAPLGFAEETQNNDPLVVSRVGTAFRFAPSEAVYGLGEKFTSLNKRGQTIDSWTVNALGTETERSYKNVPFYLSTRGYGLLVNTTNRVSFDFGDTATPVGTIDVHDDELDLFFFYGPSFPDVIETYTALTGRPPCPPKWSFGLWMSKFSYESQDEVTDVADRLQDEDLPCDVIHLDTYWMRDGHFCDLEWDREAFPDPEAMIEDLHERGYKLTLWQHPYVPVGTDAFETARDRGFLVEDGTGRPYLLDRLCLGQSRGAILDFTDEAAVEWWGAKMADLFDVGVDAFKTDFGEAVPEDAVFADGRTGTSMHNHYPYHYTEAVYDSTVDAKGEDEALVWGRSAWTGSQRFPLYWGGDPPTTFDGMHSALRGGLSLSLSGFPYWSHDIGGFLGEPSDELYARWAQFGLLSSHARCHGTTPREPWAFGDEAADAFGTFVDLRYRLLPYIFASAMEAAETGLPVVRPLVLEYQDDPVVRDMDDEYLLGDDLLVCPVLDGETETDVYLPRGEWVDFWDRTYAIGPQFTRERVPLDTVPLYLRAGRVYPLREEAASVQAATENRFTLLTVLPERGEMTATRDLFEHNRAEPDVIDVATDRDRSEIRFTVPDTDWIDGLSAEIVGAESDDVDVFCNGDRLERVANAPDAGEWTISDGAIVAAFW